MKSVSDPAWQRCGGRRRVLSIESVVGVCAVLLMAFTALPVLPAGHESLSVSRPSVVVSPVPSTAPAFPTPIRHIVTIVAENGALSEVQANGAYEMELAGQYATASSFYAVCHPSAANYLALTSGQSLQCGSDSVHPYSVQNIAHMIQGAPGRSWKAFMESMPSACNASDTRSYVARHDPFVYYPDLGSGCAANVLPLKDWNESSPSQPNYLFLTPNLYDDGHTPGGAAGVKNFDQWLKGCLSGQGPNASVCGRGGLLHEPWFASSVIWIVYDEAAPETDVTGYAVSGVSNAWCDSHNASGEAVCGGQVYAIAVSPYSARVRSVSNDTTQYSLLATTEWLLGLGCTGTGLDCNASFPAVTNWFDFPTTPPPPSLYLVSGSVASPNGTGLADATLSWTNATNRSFVPVNATGGFSTVLPNGTYSFAASAPGDQPENRSVTVQGAPIAHVDLTLVPLSPPIYPVSGKVVQPNGSPIMGATVFLSNSASVTTARTNVSGMFVLSLPNGTYKLNATAENLRSAMTNVTVAGAPVDVGSVVLFVPVPLYSVDGTVAEPDGQPVPLSTTVTAIGPNVTVTVAVRNGSFHFTLPNGSYDLVVNASGVRQTSTDTDVVVHGAPVSSVDLVVVPVASSSARGFSPFGSARLLATLGGAASVIAAGWLMLRRRSARRPPNVLLRRRRPRRIRR